MTLTEPITIKTRSGSSFSVSQPPPSRIHSIRIKHRYDMKTKEPCVKTRIVKPNTRVVCGRARVVPSKVRVKCVKYYKKSIIVEDDPKEIEALGKPIFYRTPSATFEVRQYPIGRIQSIGPRPRVVKVAKINGIRAYAIKMKCAAPIPNVSCTKMRFNRKH